MDERTLKLLQSIPDRDERLRVAEDPKLLRKCLDAQIRLESGMCDDPGAEQKAEGNEPNPR